MPHTNLLGNAVHLFLEGLETRFCRGQPHDERMEALVVVLLTIQVVDGDSLKKRNRTTADLIRRTIIQPEF